jgi:hypothetical protein
MGISFLKDKVQIIWDFRNLLFISGNADFQGARYVHHITKPVIPKS